MLSENLFNTETRYLGVLCKRGHDFNSTGKSGRWKGSSGCTECTRLSKIAKRPEERVKPPKPVVEVNELLFLGVLCRNNHDYNNTGMSLRYKKGGACVQCFGVNPRKAGRRLSDKKLNFLSRVLKPDGEDGCWIWDGTKYKTGYGYWHFGGQRIRAHRASLMLFRDQDPEGFLVCHKCDNPSCVNPDHLFIGTSQDNTDDMVSKGRSYKPIGEKHHMAKLTWDNVKQIRQMRQQGVSSQELAQTFSVVPITIRRIVAHRNWKDPGDQ